MKVLILNYIPSKHIKFRWQKKILKLLLRNFQCSPFLMQHNINLLAWYPWQDNLCGSSSFPLAKGKGGPLNFLKQVLCTLNLSYFLSCDFALPVQMHYPLSPNLSFTCSGKSPPIFISFLMRLCQSNYSYN